VIQTVKGLTQLQSLNPQMAGGGRVLARKTSNPTATRRRAPDVIKIGASDICSVMHSPWEVASVFISVRLPAKLEQK
jgi:hypothetical protein